MLGVSLLKVLLMVLSTVLFIVQLALFIPDRADPSTAQHYQVLTN